MDYESSWCPGCDREIIPKRVLVPRSPPPQEPSPIKVAQTNTTTTTTTTKKTKGNVRSRTGLLHGTGRVKPNGTLKPSEVPASGPVKMRSIIDPSPLPLYCSDECRLADMGSFYTEDYHPARSPPPQHSPIIPPPPANSFSDTASSTSSDDSDLSSPLETDSVSSRSLAVLAKHYNFSIPAPPPLRPIKSSAKPVKTEFNSGMIMAGRRIAEYLKPQPDNRSEYAKRAGKQPRQPVKGWDDGSSEWRAHVYNFTTPDRTRPEDIEKAYGSQHAFSHRSSSAVISTVGDDSSELAAQPVNRTTSWQDNYETEELYAKFSASLCRKVEQRTQRCPASAPVDRSRHPSFIDSKGLLLPDIKRRPMSSESLDSDSATAAAQPILPVPRPRFETRAWSYDNVLTYPVPPLQPSRIEKRKEQRLVNGVETEIEVEVAVYDKPKCLFNFPLREYPIDYSRPRPRH